MKKIIILVFFVLFSFPSFSQDVKKDVNELKESLQSGGFLSKYTLAQALNNYSISSQGRTIEGNFERYSFKNQIDVVITNCVLYEYYSGKNNFIVVTVVKDGIAKVFIDLDADGILDEYVSGGNNFPGNLFQKEYAMYISFSVHG